MARVPPYYSKVKRRDPPLPRGGHKPPEPEPEPKAGLGQEIDLKDLVDSPTEVEQSPDQDEEPSMAWKKDRLLQYAEQMGLEVSKKDTKAKILAAIEAATP